MRLEIRTYIFAIFATWLGLIPSPVKQSFAQHIEVNKSSSIQFSMVFDEAMRNAPESVSSELRQQQSEDHQAVARSWIVGRPSLEAGYISDGLIDNVGLEEYETGVRINLWRPGERANARRLGQSYQTQFEAWQAYHELQVAGRVRSVLANIQLAEELLALETQSTTDAEQLLDITERLFDAGAIAQVDVLQAEVLLLEQRRIQLTAQAKLVDAERDYYLLTGLDVRPAQAYSESLVQQESITPMHPVLRYQQSLVALADLEVGEARRAARTSPSIRFGVRRERGDARQDYIDSLGMSFSLPFGSSSTVSAQVTDARRDKVDKEIQMQTIYRELDRQLGEIEHELAITTQSIDLSEQQVSLSQTRWNMARTAFEAGESTLNQVVIALQRLHLAEKELASLRLLEISLTVDYNQAIGVLP